MREPEAARQDAFDRYFHRVSEARASGGAPREHLAWGAIKGDLRQLPSLTVGLLTLHKKQTQPRHAEVLAHPLTHQMIACLSERCFVHVTLVRLKL